ncbi:MAG: glycoside hydrolase family 97 protein [Candidatus Saccharibacteria bacterium]|nr:glycoside hydrolase family 97 protein [Candidatus Saccharibacteria bacterium]
MFKWVNWFKRQTDVIKEIPSPNGRTICHFILKNGRIFYRVLRDDKPLISLSRLGIEICGEEPLGEGLHIVHTRSTTKEELVELLWGEDHYINNHYNELVIYLSESGQNSRIFTLRFRVFNDSVAFRYEIPPQPKFSRITISDEITEFNFDPNSTCYKIPAFEPDRYEYNYEKTTIYNLTTPVHTPFTLVSPNGYYASIHEAALYDYGSMTLKLKDSHNLVANITPLSDGTKAHVNLPFQTPWRLIMLADSAIELTLNRTMFCLNEPPKEDFSWVKTLKFIGIWWAMYVGEWTWAPGERHGATSEHAKAYIDAAVRLGISGLLIEGWNDGWEGDWLENGVNNDFIKSAADFNFEEVANYAHSNKVELVGHHETVGFVDNYERQLEAAYNYYAVNNVHYLKTGYAGSMMVINGRKEYHHSQLGVRHYQKTIELAAKKHICLDIHEPIKGTGIERTFPNLLSREGARGQEYEGGAITPAHACFLPYTRLLSGGMDYTNGIFDIKNNVKRISTTITRQIAYFVVIYSGMAMAADRPSFYEDRFPDLFEFIKKVPTNFEKTLPLAGEIGEYYVVARKERDKEDWFIAGITNETSRKVFLNLDFLENGTFSAEIYSDSDDAHYRDNPFGYHISKKTLGRSDTLDLYLAPGGGFAIHLKRL